MNSKRPCAVKGVAPCCALFPKSLGDYWKSSPLKAGLPPQTDFWSKCHCCFYILYMHIYIYIYIVILYIHIIQYKNIRNIEAPNPTPLFLLPSVTPTDAYYSDLCKSYFAACITSPISVAFQLLVVRSPRSPSRASYSLDMERTRWWISSLKVYPKLA